MSPLWSMTYRGVSASNMQAWMHERTIRYMSPHCSWSPCGVEQEKRGTKETVGGANVSHWSKSAGDIVPNVRRYRAATPGGRRTPSSTTSVNATRRGRWAGCRGFARRRPQCRAFHRSTMPPAVAAAPLVAVAAGRTVVCSLP